MRSWRWWISGRALFLEALAIAVGVLAGQIALPRVVPHLEKFVHSRLSVSLFEPAFLIVASDRDIRFAVDANGIELDIQRLYCGISLYTTKYCLMHRVNPLLGVPAKDWLLGNGSTRAAFVGDRGSEIFLSWLSVESGLGGASFANFRTAFGAYAGFGIACAKVDEQNREMPVAIRVVYTTLEAITKITDRKSEDFKRELLSAMKNTETSISVVNSSPCGRLPEA